MSSPISQSEFYMWRTLFAMVHADNVVTDEEVHFMAEALEDVAFSDEQRAVLEEDIKTPQDIMDMFKHITDQRDQAKFFKFARDLVWVDGDYGQEEQDMMLKLIREHTEHVNVDDLVGEIDMEFEEDEVAPSPAPQRSKGCSIVRKFLHLFSGD
ncbi:MAG: TerB family tellurite resistance protein [Alphaproteobacteria bacterium]|nr:TerB family tellurite resistance protein [Alphaproteobacteria bacterium]